MVSRRRPLHVQDVTSGERELALPGAQQEPPGGVYPNRLTLVALPAGWLQDLRRSAYRASHVGPDA